MSASYPTYKSTAIPWLPEMPEHWELRKAKFIFKKEKREVRQDDDVVTAFRDGQVTLRKNRREDGFTIAVHEIGYQGIRKGDLVIHGMDAFAGAIGVSDSDGKASPVYNACTLRVSGNMNYFCHAIRQMSKSGFIQSLAKGIRERSTDFRYETFGQQYLPFPPLPEQTAIANYLDAKTEKINRFIEKKEKLIALLKEQKQAVINELLVNGVYREVAKKSSGFEFFGDVPVHWNIMKLRFIGFCQNGMNKDGEYFRSGYPFISYGDVYKFEDIPTDLSGKAESTFDERITYSVIKGDVFFTRTSETIEEIGFASACTETIKDATFSGFLIRFRPRPNILLPEFSKFFFRSSLVRRFFIKEMNIMTRASLSQNLLKNLPVLIPPISEQKEIAICIQRESRKLERAISRIEKEIEKVKELKQSLIAEVVTGKIKVA